MYTNKVPAATLVGAGTAKVTTATGLSVHSRAVMSQLKVKRLLAVVSTTIANNLVSAVISFKRRPTYGSTSGEVVMGTIVVPDLLAAGKVLYKDIAEVLCYPGDQIVFEVTTAGTDGSAAAGAVICDVEYDSVEESVANQSDMVKSA
jgi:hypothetical protein